MHVLDSKHCTFCGRPLDQCNKRLARERKRIEAERAKAAAATITFKR